MSTTTRTDPHRIAVLDPAEYRLAAFEDNHEEEGFFEWLTPTFSTSGWFPYRGNFGGEGDVHEEIRERIAERAPESHARGCAVCGQRQGNRYWTFFEHVPTGEIIKVGSLCAAKVGLGSREELEAVRACEGRNLAVERGRFLAANPVARRALDWAMGEIEHYGLELNIYGSAFMEDAHIHGAHFPIEFAVSITKGFNRYASLSDKQIKVALKLADERAERFAKEQGRADREAAEEAAKRPIPADVLDGRATITGELLTAQWRDNGYDGAIKMLVADDRGFKVWGTCPQPILDHIGDELMARAESPDRDPENDPASSTELIGRRAADGNPYRVTFVATVQVADDDKCFGFVKRPSKAKVVG